MILHIDIATRSPWKFNSLLTMVINCDNYFNTGISLAKFLIRLLLYTNQLIMTAVQ